MRRSRTSTLEVARFIFSLMAMLAIAPLTGCALGGGSGSREPGTGSSLSEAAKEAKKKPEEKHKRLTAAAPVEEPGEVVTVTETVSSNPESLAPEGSGTPGAPSAGEQPGRFHLGVVGGAGLLTGDSFGGFGIGGVQAGIYPSSRLRIDLQLLGCGANFTAQSGLTGSLSNEVELAVDVSGRYYLTPQNTFLGVYPIGGFRFGSLFWDYTHPIQIDGDEVGDDYINYFAPYVGLGVSLMQTRHFHLGVHGEVGGRLYEVNTHQGLENDLFEDAWFSQFLFELSVF